jgi:hypothetical protein
VQATTWAIVMCWMSTMGFANEPRAATRSNAVDHSCRQGVLQMSVQLAERVDLTADQVETLRREIESIWTPYGVALKWNEPDPVLIVIDGPARVVPANAIENRWPIASIRFTDAHPVPSIHVSLDAIAEVIRRASHPYSLGVLKPRMVARVAGRAIAHELGHYLLATTDHASTGLMQARFSPDALVEHRDQPLRLDSQHTARLTIIMASSC